ncbi:MAG: hypothetical protein ABSA92_07570 [Candidatus Bathyarchaeia archaeon]
MTQKFAETRNYAKIAVALIAAISAAERAVTPSAKRQSQKRRLRTVSNARLSRY